MTADTMRGYVRNRIAENRKESTLSARNLNFVNKDLTNFHEF